MLLTSTPFFSSREKSASSKKNSSDYMVLQLNGRAKEPFSLDDSVFVGAEDRLRSQFKNGPQLVPLRSCKSTNLCRDLYEDSIAFQCNVTLTIREE
jgi:hypothetical protein